MAGYVDAALFIYTLESRKLAEQLRENPYGVTITPMAYETLLVDPEGLLAQVKHVVVSGNLEVVKTILFLAMKFNFSVGVIPGPKEKKKLLAAFALPPDPEQAVELALRQNEGAMDIILCNRNILLFKAILGEIPVVDASLESNRLSLLVKTLQKFFGIDLEIFSLTTAEEKKIKTDAWGGMILNLDDGTLTSQLIHAGSHPADGMVSLLLFAPLSVVDYFRFLSRYLRGKLEDRIMPKTMGYIKSSCIEIEVEKELPVWIDGEQKTQTPLRCEAVPSAVRINTGLKSKGGGDNKDRPPRDELKIDNLPMGKEVIRATSKSIPFFPYATEERFQDLFIALREDARANAAYIVLMVLSTMMATMGLYLNSDSVIIGAMLMAPLMAPIISLSMGILRQDEKLSRNSAQKILLGVGISLVTAAAITLIFPHKPITAEMESRLQPTLLDLSVAIIAGIAGAYTKSFKEIIQSLAGVAIAVALVPPLAVAGIGIGRLDPLFFGEAFLLFATNLIGIVIAATLTFRVLGYSAALRGKRSLLLVLVSLVIVSIPLYYSYSRIVAKVMAEKRWQRERYLVNGKYLIIRKADVQYHRNKNVVIMDILTREPLTRHDMVRFKKKIQANSDEKLIVRTRISYIQ